MGNSYIHLIRHGKTEGTTKKWYYGSSDIALTSEGIDELALLTAAGIYPKGENAEIYTSGMARTEQTCFLIYGQKEHGVIKELREMEMGAFEMKTHEELKEKQEYIEWITDETGITPCPGGESPNEFKNRIKEGFEKLKNYHRLKELSVRHCGKDANSIAVCHGGVISAIMLITFEKEGKNFYEWLPKPAHGYTIIMKGGNPEAYTEF